MFLLVVLCVLYLFFFICFSCSRVRLAWARYSRFKRELYDMEAVPFARKLRMLKAEVMEILLYGCVMWTLGKAHFAELRTAHHRFLLRIVGF